MKLTPEELEARKEKRAEERAAKVAEALRVGIVPDLLYEPYVAAALLGMRSERGEKTLGEIPAAILPPHWVGPTKGLKRYYGRNLLAYIRATGEVLESDEMLRAS